MATKSSTPVTFRTPAAFRTWLRGHHRTTAELIVRCFKVHAADRGITYAQALDEALCFGWIDGVRRAYDEDTFTVRFTPRKPRSNWSRVNVRHVERLVREGRMKQPGLAAFEAREESRTGVYSFEQRETKLEPGYMKRFLANRRAWAFFQKQPPWYRRTSSFWVMSARREETRARRLDSLISHSARGESIPQLRRTGRRQ
ncbi:MAG: YdeI family protein [Gemmatimonadales bacterium]